MISVNFTFEDGVVGGLDFDTMEQANRWVPLMTTPEMLKKNKVVSFVVTVKKAQKSKVSQAA